jgi:hypothetical protein
MNSSMILNHGCCAMVSGLGSLFAADMPQGKAAPDGRAWAGSYGINAAQ